MARGAVATQDDTPGEAERNREVRKGYRDLQQDMIKNKDDLGDFSKDSLPQALANANKLHEQINRPREQAKDSEVFCTLAASGVEQAKKLAAGAKSRTAKDVIRRLKFRFATDAAEVEDDPTAYDWAAAGLHSLQLFSCAVGVGCMLGPMAAQPKVRKVTERREKTKLAAVEKPQELKVVDTQEKQETDRLMEEMFGVLKTHITVPWLELIMNVDSFSQTVENIFTLSFLVRDSKVSFTKDAEKGMLVHLVHPKKEAKGDAAGTGASIDRLQSMQSYSMMDWQDWRTYLNQSDCLMQHRTGRMYTDLEAAGPSGRRAGPSQAALDPAGARGNKIRKSAAVKPDDAEVEEDQSSDEDMGPKQRAKKRLKVQGSEAPHEDSDGGMCQGSRGQKMSKRQDSSSPEADSDGELCTGSRLSKKKKKSKRHS